jgi:ATP-dependent protease ClpP protease subunit
LIALLNFAEDGDEIQIEINNSGGNLLTALQIRNSMLNCKAHVITHLNVEASSAASIIFLSGHSYRVGKYGSLLVHEGTFGLMAKPRDCVVRVR